jgi:DNA-binding NtrC family response regulator
VRLGERSSAASDRVRRSRSTSSPGLDLPGLPSSDSAASRSSGGLSPVSSAQSAQSWSQPPQTDLPFKDAKELWVAAFEREYVASLLRKNRYNISHAAREAAIDRKYFRKLMRKHDIEGPRDEPFDDDE